MRVKRKRIERDTHTHTYASNEEWTEAKRMLVMRTYV